MSITQERSHGGLDPRTGHVDVTCCAPQRVEGPSADRVLNRPQHGTPTPLRGSTRRTDEALLRPIADRSGRRRFTASANERTHPLSRQTWPVLLTCHPDTLATYRNRNGNRNGYGAPPTTCVWQLSQWGMDTKVAAGKRHLSTRFRRSEAQWGLLAAPGRSIMGLRMSTRTTRNMSSGERREDPVRLTGVTKSPSLLWLRTGDRS